MCTWRAVNHGLCEKPRIVKSKPVIVNLKTRFRVETYDCRLIVHLASMKLEKSNRKAMNRNWSNQKANPALKTKREINKYYK